MRWNETWLDSWKTRQDKTRRGVQIVNVSLQRLRQLKPIVTKWRHTSDTEKKPSKGCGQTGVCACVRACECLCACVREIAGVRACVCMRAWVRACVCVHLPLPSEELVSDSNVHESPFLSCSYKQDTPCSVGSDWTRPWFDDVLVSLGCMSACAKAYLFLMKWLLSVTD